MNIFQSMMQRIQFDFSAPRRRASAGRNSLITAGLECLEDRRVMSADGWLPGLNNFEMESNNTRATADQIAVTSIANPNADVVFTGGIRSTTDVDYYKFTLHKTSAVQLDVYKLNPSLQMSGDVDLKLEDSSGQQLGISNRGGGNSERINKQLSAGTYFIKVYPYNSTGFGVAYQVRLQSTASSIPDPPVVPGTPIPAGPSVTSDSTPTFYWTAASHATHYELAVDNTSTGQTNAVYKSNVIGTTYTPSEAIADGVYNVRVRAWNGSVPGSWSRVHDFTLQAALPGTSVVTGPSGTNDSTPTFTWTTATNATRYELWVNNSTTGQSRVIYNSNITSTAYTPSTPLAEGRHTVWVRAWNGSVPGSWSRGYTFALTNGAVITGPTDSTDSTPTLTWTSVPGATRYELWVTGMTTGRRVIYEANLASNSYTPSTAMAAGNYRAWVRSWNGTGAGNWSTSFDFSITAISPGTSSVTGPSNTTDSTPTFAWTAATDATRYELWVTNTTTGQRVIHETSLSGTSFTPVTSMTAGNHAVWVRAWNGDVSGDWSVRRDFQLTAQVNPDPNGSNDTAASAIVMGQVGGGSVNASRNDLLNSQDTIDYFRLSVDNRYGTARFTWTLTVSEGSAADLNLSVQDYRGRNLASNYFTLTRTGNTITVQSTSSLYARSFGYAFLLKVELAPAAAPVNYSLNLVASR